MVWGLGRASREAVGGVAGFPPQRRGGPAARRARDPKRGGAPLGAGPHCIPIVGVLVVHAIWRGLCNCELLVGSKLCQGCNLPNVPGTTAD